MESESNKPTKPKNEFLNKVNNKQHTSKKKRDILDGYEWRNSYEVILGPYAKMICTLYESGSRPGLFRTEQRIGYNRIVYDGNLLFVVAETLKELGDVIVPESLRPKKEGSR